MRWLPSALLPSPAAARPSDMLGMGFGMWLTVVFFTTWLPARWKRRVVGAGLASDVTVHVVLQSLFGGDAMGRAGMLLAGILINMTMHAYRHAFGYERFSRGGWVRHAGRLT